MWAVKHDGPLKGNIVFYFTTFYFQWYQRADL